MKIFFVFVISIVLTSFTAYCQMGGAGTYQFLYLTNSPRVAALGGNNITLNESDPALAYQNPALLNDSMNKHLALNYVNYFTDINYGYVGYAMNFPKYGNVSVGVHHINYGKFDGTDEAGVYTGKFYAAEYAFNLIYSRKIDSSFRVGINIKPVLSILEHYKSFGVVADYGIFYNNEKRKLASSFVVKNFGTQIKSYYSNHYEPIDFDLQLGVTKKLKHAPLRISITAQHLENWKLTFTNPNSTENGSDLITGQTKKKSKLSIYGDEFMRHIIIGTEIILSKNFYVGLGYNYQRRKEMLVETRPFMVGTSWGFGFRISKFNFSYARASFNLAGASNLFSISTNFADFYKKEIQ